MFNAVSSYIRSPRIIGTVTSVLDCDIKEQLAITKYVQAQRKARRSIYSGHKDTSAAYTIAYWEVRVTGCYGCLNLFCKQYLLLIKQFNKLPFELYFRLPLFSVCYLGRDRYRLNCYRAVNVNKAKRRKQNTPPVLALCLS